MADLKGARVGCAMTGSFCTFSKAFLAFRGAARGGRAELFPIMSDKRLTPLRHALWAAPRPMRARLHEICGREIWHTFAGCGAHRPRKSCSTSCSSPPCTGQHAGQTGARSLRDTAGGHGGQIAPAQRRQCAPRRLHQRTASAAAPPTSGALLAMKHIFFVPFRQDDFTAKPDSLVADFALVPEAAGGRRSRGKQMQPLLLPGQSSAEKM